MKHHPTFKEDPPITGQKMGGSPPVRIGEQFLENQKEDTGIQSIQRTSSEGLELDEYISIIKQRDLLHSNSQVPHDRHQ